LGGEKPLSGGRTKEGGARMMKGTAVFLGLLLLTAVTVASADTAEVIFPTVEWSKASPTEAGLSPQKLETARQHFQTLSAASLVVVRGGRVILEWGDAARRIKVSSVRKSLLSALYGRYVREGIINLDATLDQLGIDDDPPLTMAEKQAPLRSLIEARSGICHPFVGGTPSMLATLPARGSHPPGTFWYYNNWDFNVLGTVFERAAGKRIGEAFRDEIAGPIGMQDFRSEDVYYDRSIESVHPTYAFRLSARDMARFGYLYLRDGNWGGRQVIPKDWIIECTSSYSDAGAFPPVWSHDSAEGRSTFAPGYG
jgi:CubicO group peptidase (beta-lactamase class C family)